MVDHNQIYNATLTFRDTIISISHSVQKATPPFRVSSAGTSPNNTQKFGSTSHDKFACPLLISPPEKHCLYYLHAVFENLVKIPLPSTGLFLLWELGRNPPLHQPKVCSSTTWKISPNRLQHRVEELTPNKISKKEA